MLGLPPEQGGLSGVAKGTTSDRLRCPQHRCIPSTDPSGRCVRCIKRNEECKFKTRLHVSGPRKPFSPDRG